jgi:transcriptional regulator of acetoin/glycerol metabolism
MVREGTMFDAELPVGKTHADAVIATAQGGAALNPVAASWRRSLMHHGLHPAESRAQDRLDDRAMRERVEASGPLLEIARPILDRLAAAAVEAGCAVYLTDSDGVILDERVRAADKRCFDTNGLGRGTCWAEASEGTNGIGTCLAERRPVIVHRDQHFRSRHTGLSCMGAPVFGATGELAAILDLSSWRADLSESYARLIAMTVNDAARRIEREVFRAAFVGARIVEAEPKDGVGPILLAVDRDDLVVGATRAARKRYRLADADVAARRPASDVLGCGTREPGLRAAERSELQRALARARGNVSAAARDLGIGRATFYRKMKDLKVEVPRPS